MRMLELLPSKIFLKKLLVMILMMKLTLIILIEKEN